MKRVIAVLAVFCLLLCGCESAPPAVETPAESKADVIPFSGEQDWFLYQDHVYVNIQDGGRCRVVAASVDGSVEPTVLLEGGHIYDRVGSVLIAAGNGHLMAMELAAEEPIWTTLYSFSTKAAFRFGFAADRQYILYTTIGRSVTSDGKQLILDLEHMTAALSEPRHRIEALVRQDGMICYVQRSAGGYALRRATPDFASVQTLATVDELLHYFDLNDGKLMNYRVRYVPDDPLPVCRGHRKLLFTGDVVFSWIYDTEQEQLLDAEETEYYPIQGYTFEGYRLSRAEEGWQIVGPALDHTVSLVEKDAPLEGFAANEKGVVLEQGGLWYLAPDGRAKAIDYTI